MSKYTIKYSKDRVAEAKEIRLALREGRPTWRIPYEFMPELPNYKYTFGERVRDIGKELEYQVDYMNSRFNDFGDCDALPLFTTTHLGQGLIPSMFGAKQVVVEHNQPFTEGRILANLESDLPKLKKRIDPDSDGWGPLLKQTVLAFLDATNGEIPIHVCDHQSPYGIATKLLGNEDLMLAMFDTPEFVHELMDIVTTAISDEIKAVQRWVGNSDLVLMNDADGMPGGGLVLWDDYISVITPSLHETFCLPYNLRLFKEFGRGHLHTCGPNFPAYIDAVLKNDPVSIDAIFLRGTSKTKEDLLMMKKIAREKGVILRASLITYKHHLSDPFDAVFPDGELINAMKANGGLYWHEYGSKTKWDQMRLLAGQFGKIG